MPLDELRRRPDIPAEVLSSTRDVLSGRETSSAAARAVLSMPEPAALYRVGRDADGQMANPVLVDVNRQFAAAIDALGAGGPGAPVRDGAPWLPAVAEAAATGLDLLTPERLEVARFAGERPAPGAFLAGVLGAALAGSGVASGRIALAGHPAAGELLAAVRILEGEGWTFADGNGLARRFRQEKALWEVAEARRVAAATCEAFHRLASRLAAAREALDELEAIWRGRVDRMDHILQDPERTP